MTRILFTAIFFTLFSHPAWADYYCSTFNGISLEKNCTVGDTVFYASSKSDFEIAAEITKSCDLSHQVVRGFSEESGRYFVCRYLPKESRQ